MHDHVALLNLVGDAPGTVRAHHLLESNARCLLFLCQRDGDILTTKEIGDGSVRTQQNASRAVHNLMKKAYVRRETVVGGSRHRYTVAQEGRDVVAELEHMLDAAIAGADVALAVPLAAEAWNLVTPEGRALLATLGAKGLITVRDLARYVGVNVEAAEAMLRRLTQDGVLNTQGPPGAAVILVNKQAQVAVEGVRAHVVQTRAVRNAWEPGVQDLDDGALRVLMEASAGPLKRGDMRGKAEAAFLTPGARRHLVGLLGLGFVMQVEAGDGQEPRWVASSEGLRVAAGLRERHVF